MRPKIKICGLTREPDIMAVNATRPEFIGFVFAPQSRRFVPYDKAAELRELLDPGIIPVGVFVDADMTDIIGLAMAGIIEAVQLHGHEDAGYVKALHERIPKVPVIKALQMDAPADEKQPLIYEADCWLLDTGTGGTGKPFNWRMLDGICRAGRIGPMPFFLAGGIDEGNLDEALALEPYAIDVSSGVETDGLKDPWKIVTLISKLRKDLG
ncbi:MAG: phosphoribosylanthranilate isomerase [Clostridiales Family XIII bacterium]|jgi:phosphoribosylanthranilate isomerase|nr:phosphoribosylanthranilate isomerase [Clostridiales Family XIII bacterium]